MATILNITDRIKNEKKSIQIGDTVLGINTSFDTIIEMQALDETGKSEIEKMQSILELLLGEDYQKLRGMKLSMENIKVVFTAIMAVVNACTYDEMEARFQAAQN